MTKQKIKKFGLVKQKFGFRFLNILNNPSNQLYQKTRPGHPHLLQVNPQKFTPRKPTTESNSKMDIINMLIMMLFILFSLLCHNCNCSSNIINSSNEKNREIIEIKGENDVVWIVQLSDLHFSVHYPERAFEFQKFVSSTLSMISPSLVLITGDLTGIILLSIFFYLFVCVF